MKEIQFTEIAFERGGLLFEDEPGYLRYHHRKMNRFLKVSFLGFGILALGLTWGAFAQWDVVTDQPVSLLFLFVVLAVLSYMAFFTLLWTFAVRKPFRIYDNGVMATKVPFTEGIRGRDRFVPFRDVRRITLEHSENFKWVRIFGFHYSCRGKEERFYVGLKDPGNKRIVLDLLRDLCPQVIDEDAPGS